MFKNRSVQIQLVKNKKADGAIETTKVKSVDTAEIAKIATDYTLTTIAGVGALIAAHKILTTACDIAVIAAKAKFK